VFIAAGAQESQRIGIPGELEDLEGFYYGLKFLRDVKLGKEISVGRRVAIVGGGALSLDVAHTSLRLGADEVSVYEMRSRGEMIASDEEYAEAVEEGVELNFLTSPTRILSDNWKVTGLQCIRMELGEPTVSGRGRPLPVTGSEFSVEVDTVIVSVGQAPDLSFLPRDSALERTKWETLSVDNNSLSTNIPGQYPGRLRWRRFRPRPRAYYTSHCRGEESSYRNRQVPQE